VAACQGGRLVVYFTNRKNAPLLFSTRIGTRPSLVLKWLKHTMGKTSYMVGTNRFYHVYHFSTALRDPNELQNFENQFENSVWSEEYNYEQNFFDLNRIIVNLGDARRNELFKLCGELIGSTFSLRRLDDDNELSVRYIDVDGQNLSVASTGTRLLMTVLGICMDDRFKTLLIDEPELGLSPRVQRALAAFLQDSELRQTQFPHLKQVILATHSQLFLHAGDLRSNYVVHKEGAKISLQRVTSIADFHHLQFNLLGNSLEGLFLPSAVVYVEGDTDQAYIQRVIGFRFPGRNVVVVRTGGDPKRKVAALRETLGDLQRSPLRSRLFVVLDSRHSPGVKTELVGLGVPDTNVIVWDRNGIENVYPPSILSAIFGCPIGGLPNLTIGGDQVSLNGIQMTKKALCEKVLERILPDTTLPSEFLDKLLEPLGKAIG
jgi:hypothetical protein